MLINLLYNGNLCKLDQETRNLIIFSEYFWKRCLQPKWKTKSDTRNIPNWARFALTYRHPGHFLKTARVSVFEQGWVSQFEVMQYLYFHIYILNTTDVTVK
ncbi:Hypothetical_protein [Hexamita inflata]|uniref:Hypothetical_protein n=1 Tax=Hexamita inflata TaxID=28002 RepID=A0AA86Q318_9EUKA|nr:Hypothetical protein HINF_LOCUS37301 [Hexamita inflata]